MIKNIDKIVTGNTSKYIDEVFYFCRIQNPKKEYP
jgi:hypothetical protein